MIAGIDLTPLENILKILGDLGAIGTTAFAIFLVYCAYFKKDPMSSIKKDTGGSRQAETNVLSCQNVDMDLKKLLKNLLGEVEKIGGNDLSHLKLAVDTLGTSVGRLESKVSVLEEKLDAHDKQALTILNTETAIVKSVDEIKRLIERPLFKG